MGGVTTATALSLDRYVFINEWSLLVGVALDANRVPGRHGSYLAEGGCAMNVMAVAALDETFFDSMMKRLGEVGFGSRMTSVAEIGLCLN